MITRCRRALLLLLVLLVTGCAQFKLANSGEQIKLGDAFTFTPQREWSRLDLGDIELWTVDGSLLDEMIVYKGVEDGENLLVPNPQVKNPDDFPVFQKTMSALEVRDLLEATFARTLEVDLQSYDMKPWKFGDTSGFRFEYNFTSKVGLRMRGFTVGAVYEEKLYMIVFSAAELHYYKAFEGEFEQIVASIVRQA